MPSVVLLRPDGGEVTVASRKSFVQLIYGGGYQPKTGSVADNYRALGVAEVPPAVDELSPVLLTDLDDATSEARVRLGEAYAEPAAPETVTGQWVFRTAVISRANDTSAQIDAKTVGDTADGVFNWRHNGDFGYLFHLTTGPDLVETTYALIGMGIDYGGIGLLVRNKNIGVGIKVAQLGTVTGGGHYGLWVAQSNTTIPAARFEQIVAGASPAAEFYADGTRTAGQKLTRWANDAGEIGYVDAQSGNLVWKGAVAGQRPAGFNAFMMSRNGDSQQRLAIDVDGKHNWSSGAAAADTVLERKAAKVLGTGADNAFRVGAVATASRIAAATAGAGASMFDTTLGKPIWSDGVNWKDATGAIV